MQIINTTECIYTMTAVQGTILNDVTQYLVLQAPRKKPSPVSRELICN